MTKPTTLKLYDFVDESFIHGCYIPNYICDDLIKYFDEHPDRHKSGESYGTGNINTKIIVDDVVKKSTDIGFFSDADGIILSDYMMYLNMCIREYEYKYHQADHLLLCSIEQ